MSDRKTLLQQIISDPASTPDEITEAKRELNPQPSPQTQSEEDALIEVALDHPKVTGDDPRYGEALRRLCSSLWPDCYMFAGVFEPAEQEVANLISLYHRTCSERVKAAALFTLRQFAGYSQKAQARNDARRFLCGEGLNGAEDFLPINLFVTSLQAIAARTNDPKVIQRLETAKATGQIPEDVRDRYPAT